MRFASDFVERRFSSVFDLPREHVSRKGAKASTDRKRCFQRRNHVYLAKTLPRKGGNAFLLRENVRKQKRKSVYRGKKGFPSKNALRRCENVFTRKGEKAFTRTKTFAKAIAIPSEDVASQRRKRLYRDKMSRSQRRKRFLPSENNACKGENAITERKRLCQGKTSLAKAESVSTERIRPSHRRKFA